MKNVKTLLVAMMIVLGGVLIGCTDDAAEPTEVPTQADIATPMAEDGEEMEATEEMEEMEETEEAEATEEMDEEEEEADDDE